jgi:Uma2 family endonuclease
MLKSHGVPEAEFDRWVMLPENAGRNFEYIAGEIVEGVSNNKSSRAGLNIMAEVRTYVKQQRLGRTTGADGGYVVAGERYIPDGAFVSFARQPVAVDVAYNPVAPDLAVEVLSPGNEHSEIVRKVGNYLAAGTVIWVIDPDDETVNVYTPGLPRVTLRREDMLSGDAVLPGFRLAVADIFSE